MLLKQMLGEEEALAACKEMAARERAKIISVLVSIGNPFQEYWKMDCRGTVTLLKASNKVELLDKIGEVTKAAPHGNGAILAVRHKGVCTIEPIGRKAYLHTLIKLGKEAI